MGTPTFHPVQAACLRAQRNFLDAVCSLPVCPLFPGVTRMRAQGKKKKKKISTKEQVLTGTAPVAGQ